MFTQSLLSDIRDRIPISSLIGERISLKKSGRNFKGLCPFHSEKTPSFMVSDEKQIYHCFGCGEGGDIFSFIMKYDSLSFAEAVKVLAAQAGVEIPKDEFNKNKDPDAEFSRKKKWSLRLNKIAMDWFESRLNDDTIGKKARNYLISRGIKSEIWTQLNIGVADNDWEALHKHLLEKGAPLDLAAELGLVRKRDRDNGYYDFFRGRLIFPIFSARGEVIAFGGRALNGDNEAKYLNSPDSLLFHKSTSIYGLNWAKEHIRKGDQALIVEGYIDVISLLQAGIQNVVAPLGTALTLGHIRILMRITRNIVLLFDGDDAGKKAAIRSLPLFVELGIMPRAVILPKGEDPDSLVRKQGQEAIAKKVENAVSLFDIFLDDVTNKTGVDAAGKVEALTQIVPLLKQMQGVSEQGIYSQRVAEKLGTSEALIREAVGGKRQISQGFVQKKMHKNIVVPSAERVLVDLMVQQPDLAPKVLEQITPEEFDDGFGRNIASIFKKSLDDLGHIYISEILNEIADPELEREVRSLSMTSEKFASDEVEDVLNDCIQTIKNRSKRKEMLELNRQIKIAESEGNEEQLLNLLRRKNILALEENKL